MKRRSLTLCMAFCMALSLLTVGAAAAPAVGQEGTQDDLFYQYMLQRAREEQGGLELQSVDPETAGSRLTQQDKKIYDLLRDRVALVAEGKESSTVFTFTPKDLCGKYGPWTEKELGTPLIENNTISDAAMDVLTAKLSCSDYSAIQSALRADCPYELYWHDKIKGTRMSPGTRVTYSTVLDADSGRDVGALFFTEDTALTISFAVSQEYAPEGATQFDTVSKDKIARYNVSGAVKKALEIVKDNQYKSDLEKLLAYKKAICDAVSYNEEAAKKENKVPYGNPWQLIYVFDQDPETNVVCEGYSKAFQYLCDLTEFDGAVQCYSVTGVMGGGTGEGRHMWNIVSMPDGKNYLVDVTNVDGDSALHHTIGYPDKLFLKGVTPTELQTGVSEPAQTVPGYMVRVGREVIWYLYDDSMADLWGDDLLTLSQTDYVESQSPTVSGSMAVAGTKDALRWTLSAGEDGGVLVTVRGTGITEETPVLAGSYDTDGRMVGVKTLTAGENVVLPPEGTARVRLFWIDRTRDNAPRCAQGEVPLSGTESR